jgi:hypothetical protein
MQNNFIAFSIRKHGNMATIYMRAPLNSNMSEYVDGTFRCTICAKEFLTKKDADTHYHDDHSAEVIDIHE